MPPNQNLTVDFLNDNDIASLLADGPLTDNEATQFSNIEMDLDTMSLESLDSLLTDDLKINMNTLENVSSFAAILSPSMLNSMFTATSMPLQCDKWSVTTRSENYSPSSLSSDLSFQSPYPLQQGTNQLVLGRQKQTMIKKKVTTAAKSSNLIRQMDAMSCDESDGISMTDKGPSRMSSCGGNVRTGRWSPDEHRKFLQGIAQYGRNWDKVAQNVLTRTTVQVRSHAQKYFKKLVHRDGMLVGSGNSKPRDSGTNCDAENYGDDSSFNIMTDEMIMERAKQELM